MKIVVLSGSPKDDLSITLQYVRFMQKKFPQHELKIIDISSRIEQVEKDDNLFQRIISEVRSSDAVLWAFPVYYFLVPSQYKRFIELIWKRSVQDAFRDKYAAALTTSVHFYDHAAHNYINAICDDLEMKFLDSFSAGMHDFLKKEERQKFYIFVDMLLKLINGKSNTAVRFNKLKYAKFLYAPAKATERIDATGKKIIVLADVRDGQSNLTGMINRFTGLFSHKPEVINLNDITFKGGCLGCIHCGLDNVCIYHETDGYSDLYHKLMNADVLIFAGSIYDRYLSSKWKLFFDRSFFKTHIPSFAGKQMGFMISGPLRQLSNLRQILEAYVECMQANLVEIVTDEDEDSARIDSLLQDMAKRLIEEKNKSYIRPCTFLSIGGRKVLRDEIWGKLRFIFQADNRYFIKNRMYDFPQKNIKARFFAAVMIIVTKIPLIKKSFVKNIKVNMVKDLKKIINRS